MLCWSNDSSAPSPDCASAARTRARRYSCKRRKLMRSSKSTWVWPGACSGRFQLWCGSMSSGLTMLGSGVFFGLAIDVLGTTLRQKPKYATRPPRAAPENSGLWESQLPGEPVGGRAAIPVGAVVGVVPPVLDDEQLDRPGDALREPLGVGRRHEPVLASGDDEDRAGDLRRGVLHRERLRVLARIGLGLAMAAHAERLAREEREILPDLLPLERAGDPDAGLDPLLVRGGARRVIAAQAHAPHRDSRGIQVGALLDPVARGLRRALVVAADRDVVLGLALSRPVDRENRDPARKKRLLVRVQLLLGRVQARRHDENGKLPRAGFSKHAVERLPLERYRDALARRPHQRQRVAVAGDG